MRLTLPTLSLVDIGNGKLSPKQGKKGQRLSGAGTPGPRNL